MSLARSCTTTPTSAMLRRRRSCIVALLSFKVAILTRLSPPTQTVPHRSVMQTLSPALHLKTENLYRRLGDRDLDNLERFDAFLLQLAFDQVLKLSMCTQKERDELAKKHIMDDFDGALGDMDWAGLSKTMNNMPCSNGQTATGQGNTLDESEIRRRVHLKLARAARTRQYVSMKIRHLFEGNSHGQQLHDRIDIEDIASRMKKTFSKIAAMTLEERRSAVAHDLEEFGLDKWPRSSYLNF